MNEQSIFHNIGEYALFLSAFMRRTPCMQKNETYILPVRKVHIHVGA